MSDSERTAMLVGWIRETLAEAEKIDPKVRFQRMVDVGLITPEGKLRWNEEARSLGSSGSEE
jgi:hypothetical protein